jgi:hypothetical protein
VSGVFDPPLQTRKAKESVQISSRMRRVMVDEAHLLHGLCGVIWFYCLACNLWVSVLSAPFLPFLFRCMQVSFFLSFSGLMLFCWMVWGLYCLGY